MSYLSDLKQRRAEIVAELNAAKAALDDIDQHILAATQSTIEQLFELTGKQGGTVTGEIEGLKIKGSRSKTVKWDSAKLREIARELDAETFDRLIKMDLSIPERTYDFLDAEMRAKVDAARTVKYGDLKVVFVDEGDK